MIYLVKKDFENFTFDLHLYEPQRHLKVTRHHPISNEWLTHNFINCELRNDLFKCLAKNNPHNTIVFMDEMIKSSKNEKNYRLPLKFFSMQMINLTTIFPSLWGWIE